MYTVHIIPYILFTCLHSEAIIDKQNINSSCIAHHNLASVFLLRQFHPYNNFQHSCFFFENESIVIRCVVYFFSFVSALNLIIRKKTHAHTQFSYSIRLRQSVFFFKQLSLVSCYPLIVRVECAPLNKHSLDRRWDVVCIIEKIHQNTTNEMNTHIHNTQTRTNVSTANTHVRKKMYSTLNLGLTDKNAMQMYVLSL